MKRLIYQQLSLWKAQVRRKPLIVRGARQVGKTYSIENFAHEAFHDNFLKIDLEKEPALKKIFLLDLDVKRILSELELIKKKRIIPGETLLFIDEIQGCPEAIMALRYFYEDLPALHVIAAGSLLEFAFEKISFPVGRVQFLAMCPLNFVEYLWALGYDDLAMLLQQPPQRLSDSIHQALRQELSRYFIIGGMPEAVSAYVNTKSLQESQLVHRELIDSFRNDFSKYAPRANKICLEEVFTATARYVGDQIKYARLSPDFSNATIKQDFQLLSMAEVVTPVYACNPPELPLGATIHPAIFKAIMVDIGIMQSLCDIPISLDELNRDLFSGYRGALAEQFVGQELKVTQRKLYYWIRLKKNSSAEIDYLIMHKNQVIPVEVKSGARGKMRSLHNFLESYTHIPYAYVFRDAPYEVSEDKKLIFLPFYYVYAATIESGLE